MLAGTKKIFPTDYEKFKEAMIEAAEGEKLPVALQMDNTNDISLKDIRDMFYEFQRDTGLSIIGSLFLCDECSRLHLIIEVDYPDVDEKDERLIQ